MVFIKNGGSPINPFASLIDSYGIRVNGNLESSPSGFTGVKSGIDSFALFSPS